MLLFMVAILVLVLTFLSLLLRKRRQRREDFAALQRHLLTGRVPQINGVHKKLQAVNKDFEKRVLTVKDRIHVALGYGLANCVLLEGNEGCVLIDAMESQEAVLEVLEAFGSILSLKPIEAIILTHFHTDHSYGIEAVAKLHPKARIIVHESFDGFIDNLKNVRAPITFKRSMFQFGTLILEHLNCGFGNKLRFYGDTLPPASIKASDRVKDRLRVDFVDGIDVEVIHAPGETPDQLIVWWESEKTLFPADNIYRAMPNLYAIRGTMSRDALIWCEAIDAMIKLDAEYLVPQHTKPLEGKEAILEAMTAYRDAIQLIHDQTVRLMNKGLCPDEIASQIHLPPSLSQHPFLQELYGTVEWNSKAVFSHYLGWFSGRSSDLHRLSRQEKAELLQRLAELGESDLLARAEEEDEEEEKGNLQWALQLSDAALLTAGGDSRAKLLKARCLRRMAEKEVSANGRNWLFTAALETEGLQVRPGEAQRKHAIYSSSLEGLFLMMAVRIDPSKAEDAFEVAHFHFSDVKEDFVLMLRGGVLIVSRDIPSSSEITFRVWSTSRIWREILAKDRSGLWAFLTGNLYVKPTIFSLTKFISYFDTDA